MFVATYLALAILKHLYIVLKWHHLVLCHVHLCTFESANCIIVYTNCTMLMEGAFEMCLASWTLWESFLSPMWTYPRSWNSVIGIRCLNVWGAQFWVFHDFARLAALLEEVSSVEDNKTLIFVETKKKVENITRSIRRYGWVFLLLYNIRTCMISVI